MFMEGPDSIKKPSINLPTQIAAGAANKVSEGGVSAVGGVNPKVSEGASVAGNGKSPAAGQALLEMMANNIVPTNGFFKGKIQGEDSVKGEATIETHAAAFFADGLGANGKVQKSMELASRGTEPSSGKVSQREIKPGRQAVIPLDGPDAELGAVLRHAFSLADRPPTAEESIRLFKESNC